MRKQTFNIAKLLVFILVATFASCTEEMDSVEYPEFSSSHLRSYSEAIEIAQRGISMLEGNSGTRSENGTRRKIDMNGFKCVTSKPTRSGDVDTLLYVVNFEDNQGYAIVSARRDVEGLLAVTESGSYDPLHKSENEGLNMFMDLASGYERGPLIPVPGHEPIVTRFYKGPYITVRWGQEWPEGYYFQNGIAGCVNTAIAQAMSYYRHPAGISITYPEADVSYQQLDWTELKRHIRSESSYDCQNPSYPNICNAQYGTHLALARLCRQLGELFMSDYSDSTHTGTNHNDVSYYLSNIGYSSTIWQSYSLGTLKTTIDSNDVLCMVGSCNAGAHMWIADGYCHEDIFLPGFGIDGTDIHEHKYYNHINWGWNGKDNGYFIDNVWDTGNPKISDGIIREDHYNLNTNVLYMIMTPIN